MLSFHFWYVLSSFDVPLLKFILLMLALFSSPCLLCGFGEISMEKIKITTSTLFILWMSNFWCKVEFLPIVHCLYCERNELTHLCEIVYNVQQLLDIFCLNRDDMVWISNSKAPTYYTCFGWIFANKMKIFSDPIWCSQRRAVRVSTYKALIRHKNRIQAEIL